MLLTVDLDEDFIDVERVAIASVFELQAQGINRAKLDTPETDRFPGDNDASLSEQVFNISMA
jgi:hypothetical protein